jgi:hypothetical protein
MPTFPAGTRITSSVLALVAPLAAVKTSPESVVSSTVLQNDDALFLTVAANSTYKWKCQVFYVGGTQASSDIKVQWTGPGSAALSWNSMHFTTAGAFSDTSFNDFTTVNVIGTNGAGNNRTIHMEGTLVTVSAGTFQLQWAQNTSSATATQVLANSTLLAWKTA